MNTPNSIKLITGIAALSVVFGATVLSAQQQIPALPAVVKQPQPKYTEVKYSADMSSYRWEGEDRVLVLTGNVKFVQGDTVMTADKIDYRESTRTATATGNLKIHDDQSTITGDLCTVNFKEKKGSITGKVQMVAKPKEKPKAEKTNGKPKSEWKDDVTITCERIDYYYKDKKADVPSPLTIVQKTRVITADSAKYFGKDEILNLVGNVKARDDKERQSVDAPEVTMSLKDDNQWLEAKKATGSFYVKEDDEESKPAEKPSAPATPAASSPEPTTEPQKP